ncbi:hypothetical protein IIW29_02590, partial [Candidatus Saccharibacteria bacterium]|nr:hypothetical protein [Candidatus Saccharibacteria bacterium]
MGTLTARTLAILHDKPLYAVHHLKSHVYANWLITDNQNSVSSTRSSRPVVTGGTSLSRSSLVANGLGNTIPDCPSFPILALVVSGGHTQILYMPGHNQFEIIGTTRDDAALSANIPEGSYIRRHIIADNPDVILNVVCSSNLERNL